MIPYSYGTTGNAASTALSWGMSSVLPDIPGIDINGLLYKYTTVKDPDADMKVHIGNKNVDADGYIFRKTDDWSGVPGNTSLNRFPFLTFQLRNGARVQLMLKGKVRSKMLWLYIAYRLDECYDEQSNPAARDMSKPIPVIPVVELYDVLEDDDAMAAIDADTDFQYDEDGNLILSEEERRRRN